MRETWYPVKGFSKYEVNKEGQIRNTKTRRILTPHITPEGYSRVCLMSDDGLRRNLSVHGVVANTFYDYDHETMIASYLDGDRRNNRADNVYLADRSNVMKRWYDKHDDQHTNAHARRAVRCRETGEEFISIREASRAMNVGVQSISRTIGNPKYKTRDGYSFELID